MEQGVSEERQFSNISYFKTAALLAALVLMAIAYVAPSGDRIPIGGGFGWDGEAYGQLALGEIATNDLSAYQVGRILPSFLVRFLQERGLWSGFEGVGPTFFAVNVACVFVTLFAFLAACHRLQVSTRAALLTGSFVVLNYPCLKLGHYNPVLTDLPALAMGAGMLYAWVANLRALLAVTVVAGAFTFPNLPLLGMVLLALPYRGESFVAAAPSIPLWQRLLALLAASVAFLALYFNYRKIVSTKPHLITGEWTLATPVVESLWGLSLLCLLSYLLFVCCIFLPRDVSVRGWFRAISWEGTLLGVGIYIAGGVMRRFLASEAAGFSFWDYVDNVTVQALVSPGVSFVSAIAYFGPLWACLLLVIATKRGAPGNVSKGLAIASLGGALFAIGSESRQLLPFVPVIGLYAALSLRDIRLPGWFLAVVVGIQLVWSRFWFRIGPGYFPDSLQDPEWQKYFAVHGPWMSFESYKLILLLGSLSVLMLAGLWWLASRQKTHDEASSGISRKGDEVSRELPSRVDC